MLQQPVSFPSTGLWYPEETNTVGSTSQPVWKKQRCDTQLPKELSTYRARDQAQNISRDWWQIIQSVIGDELLSTLAYDVLVWKQAMTKSTLKVDPSWTGQLYPEGESVSDPESDRESPVAVIMCNHVRPKSSPSRPPTSIDPERTDGW